MTLTVRTTVREGRETAFAPDFCRAEAPESVLGGERA